MFIIQFSGIIWLKYFDIRLKQIIWLKSWIRFLLKRIQKSNVRYSVDKNPNTFLNYSASVIITEYQWQNIWIRFLITPIRFTFRVWNPFFGFIDNKEKSSPFLFKHPVFSRKICWSVASCEDVHTIICYPNTPENKTDIHCGPSHCTGVYSVWTVWSVVAEARSIQPVGLGGCAGPSLPSWPSTILHTRHGLSWLQFNQAWGLPHHTVILNMLGNSFPIINDYADTWIKYWWKCKWSKMDYLKKSKICTELKQIECIDGKMQIMATIQWCASEMNFVKNWNDKIITVEPNMLFKWRNLWFILMACCCTPISFF